ncbi:multidrug DMT transporter permease [Echinicola soli]|uniref:Multidrug DMT transporter permease n=1 Tax=Echinicola soli TaxID=2591634 RepID=A0A514CNA6_9BACT|nr:GRP family sugar transporter [Echinicola soli]QDH81306.1 multidrug DMT transporter permease [Echinicola soli]
MFIVESYVTAIVFCFITMLCWGSWANTQKLIQKTWRFELFYWDYVIGIFLFSLASALTLGSLGADGRPFIEDIQQAETANMLSALIGGVVFNLANILLTAAIAGAGMAVAFPIGIGIALVLGVMWNYFLVEKGDPVSLFLGVLFVTLAIVLNAAAYRKSRPAQQSSGSKWIIVSVVAGVLMSLFYRFVASSMDLENFKAPTAGMMTPYSAVVIFSVGILLSNLVFNSILLKRPLEGPPIPYSKYFKGKISWHSIGLLGGCIWALGNVFNLIAAGKAGPAISYGLGQGATLVAALWGVLIWKEFSNSPKPVNGLIAAMFCSFIIGLGLIIYSGGS